MIAATIVQFKTAGKAERIFRPNSIFGVRVACLHFLARKLAKYSQLTIIVFFFDLSHSR